MNAINERYANILKNLVGGNVREELKKAFSNIGSHMEDYHLYRCLVSLLENKETTKDVRFSIASWMVHSRHEDLPFNDIFVIDDEVYIYTTRPGLWIGQRGRTIDDCLYHINHKVDGIEYRKLHINLIESKNDAISDVYGYMKACNSYENECWDYIDDEDIKPIEYPKSNKIKI